MLFVASGQITIKHTGTRVSTHNPTFTARIDMVDALRGFALMGLFTVHVVEYFELYWLNPPANDPIHNWVFGLFAGKAFAMFALMFGLSFFIIMDRAQKRGVDFTARFLWRLVVLFIIGFFHALFYAGDVLQVLALCGIILLPLNRLSWKWLLPLAVICFAQPVLWLQLVRAARDVHANTAPLSWSYPALPVFAHGTFAQLFATNLWTGPQTKWEFMWEYGRVFQIFGLFLTGLMLGRIGFMAQPERFAAARRIGFVVALAVAIGLHFARPEINAALPGDKAHFLVPWARETLFDSYQSLAAMFLWVFGFIEVYQWKPTQALLRLLAPAGRMTLTLYVMQALIGIPIYYGCGLGLYATIGQFHALILGICIFTSQLVFAHLWFRFFLYGPLEWLWRAATYMTLKVPFRRSVAQGEG